MSFASLVSISNTLVWVIRTLSTFIISSFTMNFKESYIWEFKTYNIFAVSMDYIHCMVFTYIIFGLKNRDWSILWVLLGRLIVWPLIHGQLHNIVIQ